ncbi:MAG TPA: O-antigen ligase family protein [Chitinophagales bacterium]|nr:O-antigen ligase family protein [Chitinophagales bacterium]
MKNSAGTPSAINENTIQWAVVISCLVVFTGFVCSRALASIGMAGMVVSTLLFYRVDTLKKYVKQPGLMVISLFFLIVFFSGLYSTDKTLWLNWIRIKVPYLVLPLAFAPLKRFSEKQFAVLLTGFALIMFCSALVVLGNYCLHYAQITEAFTRGSTIPMPYSHIRYTLMLAFSFFCVLYLFSEGLYVFNEKEKWLQAVLAVFAFIALHILSVRSALLALYLGIFFMLLRYIVLQKRYVTGLVLLVLLTGTPFVAVKWVPSLHNKYAYMDYDLGEYRQGVVGQNSDGLRLVSMKVGIKLWLQHPVIGIGAGDIKTETGKIYDALYPQIEETTRRLPHNQFIWVLATTGMIGFAGFMLAFIYPFFVNGNYRWWLFAVFYMVVFSSFFTEDTLEEQIGTGFYLIFLLVFMNYKQADGP